MGRFGNSTYWALPESVQLALLAAYLYAEETYESFADFIQDRYQAFRGIDQDDEDDTDEQDAEEGTPEDSHKVDSEQDA